MNTLMIPFTASQVHHILYSETLFSIFVCFMMPEIEFRAEFYKLRAHARQGFYQEKQSYIPQPPK